MKQRKTKQNKTKKYLFAALFSTLAFFSVTACLFASLFYPNVEKRHVVTVPNLIGKNEDDPKIQRDSDFEIETVYINSSDEERGKVISQTPKSGTMRKVVDGQRVTIEVRIGRGRRDFELPSFAGADEREAILILRSHGCMVNIVRMFSSGRADGEVIDSFPAGGEMVYEGSKVTLYVAKSKEQKSVKVPKLYELSYSDALDMINSCGLTLGNVTVDSAENNFDFGMVLDDEYIVMAQSLVFGTYVKSGSVIDLQLQKKKIESDYEDYYFENFFEECSDENTESLIEWE